MDSGFLSQSTSSEAPKAPEPTPAPPEIPVEAAPSVPVQVAENLPVMPAVPVEQEGGESRIEAAFKQVEAVPVIVAQTTSDQQLPAVAPSAPTIATPPDKVAEDVQKILESNLEEALAPMPEEAKQRFIQKGREIGTMIADMVRHYKVEVKRVLNLLKDWLTAIPGVNKFFLEKEAKIKTDRILELEEARHQAVPA